jgi:hypothetical protein
MNCKEVVDVLSDYLANELSAEDADGVRMHLRQVPKLQGLFGFTEDDDQMDSRPQNGRSSHCVVNSVRPSEVQYRGQPASLQAEKKLVNIL